MKFERIDNLTLKEQAWMAIISAGLIIVGKSLNEWALYFSRHLNLKTIQGGNQSEVISKQIFHLNMLMGCCFWQLTNICFGRSETY